MSFGSRRCSVFVWPEEHLKAGVVPVDVPVEIVFDLSAVVGVLGSFPAWMGLVVEVVSGEPSAKPVNGYAATLRGETGLAGSGDEGWVVKNGTVQVPLRFVALKDVGGSQVEEEVIARDGTVSLTLQGGVQDVGKMLEEGDRPRVYVRCRYRSKELPFWDGILRHDFLCPWCHRNCYRFRTLFTHLQVEHEELGFAVEGIQGFEGGTVPMTLEFDVVGVMDNGGKVVQDGGVVDDNNNWNPKSDADTEGVYANPGGRFRALALEKRREEEMEKGMAEVSLAETAEKRGGEKETVGEDGADSTDSEGEEKDFVRIMRSELSDLCKYCARPRPKGEEHRYGKTHFCSEYCDVMYKNKMAEADNPEERQLQPPPMVETATVPRAKTFDYKETLGHLKLYHIVSVSEVKEDHFDPDDPDSEDEVDHSWRLDLSMERIRSLDDASPKEKLLWMMWNKFAHENYPIPSVYAERYTRYTLELFALEYGPQVAQKKLRVQFVGFLRALHIHGLIDTVAITSIMLCLDGKKKRRQCAPSNRPEVVSEQRMRGRPRGAQKQRRSKKRS